MKREAGQMGIQAGAPGVGAVLFASDCRTLANFYAEALGFVALEREGDFVRLERDGFELLVHAMHGDAASQTRFDVPPRRRSESPIKLVFTVDNIGATRDVVERLAGRLDDDAEVWRFRGSRALDGEDPEGNVIQLREHAS
ncbi:MAG TPA: VOC family protein [Rhodanobacteraceae bacterium]